MCQSDALFLRHRKLYYVEVPAVSVLHGAEFYKKEFSNKRKVMASFGYRDIGGYCSDRAFFPQQSLLRVLQRLTIGVPGIQLDVRQRASFLFFSPSFVSVYLPLHVGSKVQRYYSWLREHIHRERK